jgi:hypothetical protein
MIELVAELKRWFTTVGVNSGNINVRGTGTKAEHRIQQLTPGLCRQSTACVASCGTNFKCQTSQSLKRLRPVESATLTLEIFGEPYLPLAREVDVDDVTLVVL